jgi:hypothetical protein
MNGNKTKQDILDQINSSINNLSHFNEQFAQYKTQNFQDMDDIATSKETLFKLFNKTKENFTGITQEEQDNNIEHPKVDLTIRIPMTGNKMTRVKHRPESSESEYYSESSYKLSKESSIDDKATKRVNTRELQSLYKGNENLYDVMRLQDREKKKSSGKFTDKQIIKDGKNSQNKFTK